ncbi:MAG: hypothetical protein IJ679_05320 [Lachnospiraceae bacterium]|nr:hypothetical protein [Lachnospiraceae bacterium]
MAVMKLCIGKSLRGGVKGTPNENTVTTNKVTYAIMADKCNAFYQCIGGWLKGCSPFLIQISAYI